METNIIPIISQELNQPEHLVKNVVDLIDEGNTIPFIARYRKEAHGAMDDTTLRKLEERLKYLRNLEERKEEICRAIEEQGKMTPQLQSAISQAQTLAQAEELYRPYKQKRRTRATIAREKGLEPLAAALWQQRPGIVPETVSQAYVNPEQGVTTIAEALAGASDIIAEQIAEDPAFRKRLRDFLFRTGALVSKEARKKGAALDRDVLDKGTDPAKGASGKEIALAKGALKKDAVIAREASEKSTILAKEASKKPADLAKESKKKEANSPGEDKSHVYEIYKEFTTPVAKIRDHQVLALNRGEKEGFLKVDIEEEREDAFSLLESMVLKKGNNLHPEHRAFLTAAIRDGYDRLLAPSLKNEIRAALTEKAQDGAIRNFALNLKPLLMQPPVKGKVTMGLDPGYRMGCKVAVVDATGKVLDTTVVYPTHGERQKAEAIRTLASLIKKHQVVHIAIGNGTASRETEQMTAELVQQCPGVSYMVVSEAGASVYSASELAAKEFPQYDVNLRSAISIARRLQDPLAELVKIDPKSIGVGQYQHDLPQKQLEESLDAVVEDCVNAVGVDLNTASESLLRRVAGLNATTAKNIVAYREEHGIYTSRAQLLKVPRLGEKAYKQCAGFLRVPESRNFLDHTGIHPESYQAAQKLLELLGIDEVKGSGKVAVSGKQTGFEDLAAGIRTYGEAKAAEKCGVGIPTLRDILSELARPGRDPRESLPAPIFRTDLLDIKDLKPGMILTGTVRNVIDFGAFVDIGVHQDGLVHISEIADHYIRHPSEVLSVGQDVKVLVLEVDEKKKRIGLSIRQAQ